MQILNFKTDKATGKYTRYRWDAENKLTNGVYTTVASLTPASEKKGKGSKG